MRLTKHDILIVQPTTRWLMRDWFILVIGIIFSGHCVVPNSLLAQERGIRSILRDRMAQVPDPKTLLPPPGPRLSRPENSGLGIDEEELPPPSPTQSRSWVSEIDQRHKDVLNRTKKINTRLTELEKLLNRSLKPPKQQVAPPKPKVVTPPSSVKSELDNRVNDKNPVNPKLPIPAPNSEFVDTFIITEHVVDRLSLANNLYGAGEIYMALRVYKEVDTTKLIPVDRAWVQFQIGQCHRRLGDKKNSDNEYRLVAQDPHGAKWAEFSKWWLSSEDRLQLLKERNRTLSDSLKSMQEQFDAISKP